MYEIVSDMSTRQDAVEERLSNLEDKLQTLQVQFCPQDHLTSLFAVEPLEDIQIKLRPATGTSTSTALHLAS